MVQKLPLVGFGPCHRAAPFSSVEVTGRAVLSKPRLRWRIRQTVQKVLQTQQNRRILRGSPTPLPMPRKSQFDPAQFGLFAMPLDAMIDEENEVRLIAAFVDQLNLPELGFKPVSTLGAAAYGPELMLKLYIYGYLNRVRSSRRLERECRINVEVIWLTERLQPKYHSIADFRKQHPAALKRVFKEYVLLLRDWKFITGQRLAADGTKVHAQNSRKRNFNDKKLQRHLDRLDKNIEQSLREFADRDVQEDCERKAELQQQTQDKIAALKQRRVDYERMQSELRASGETQLSLTDADARSLIKKGLESLVGYNVQSVVDAENKLIVHTEVTNTTDVNALAGLAAATKATLAPAEQPAVEAAAGDASSPTGGQAGAAPQSADQVASEPASEEPTDNGKAPPQFLADKGYHTASQLAAVEDLGFDPYVAERRQVRKGQNNSSYGPEEFSYDAEQDVYHCPAGQRLRTTGQLHQRRPKKSGATGTSGGQHFRYYRGERAVCEACPLRDQCLSEGEIKNRKGKTITRQEHAAAVERNRARLKADPEVYRQRQAIVEHPFGTIKRHWTGYYTLLRGREKVDGEYNLLALCYNLRRSITIAGVPALIELLKARKELFLANMPAIWSSNTRKSSRMVTTAKFRQLSGSMLRLAA